MINKEIQTLHNNFRVIMTDTITGEKTEVAYAENIVLNRFKTLFLNRTPCSPMLIAIGTGLNQPDVADTGLQTEIYRGEGNFVADTSQCGVGGNGTILLTGSMRIQASELIGQAISEIGLVERYRSSGYWYGQTLVTRALLKDSNGNSVVINKTNTMILDIYATAYMVIPKTISGYKNIYGWGYNTDIYSGARGFSLFLDDAVSFRQVRVGKDWSEYNPVVVNNSFTVGVSSTLDAPTKVRTYNIAEIPVGTGNIGGIRSVLIGNHLEMFVPNDTFPQSILTKEVIGIGDGIKTAFGTKFGWIRDNGTCKIFINDIEQVSGVTVKFNLPPSAVSINYLQGIEGKGYRNMGSDANYIPYGEYYGENKTGKAIKRFNGTLPHSSYHSIIGGTPLSCSNDLITWVAVTPNADIPSQYQDYTYWRWGFSRNLAIILVENEIIFNTPPANTAVISCTYQPDCIAKDENKVIRNMSFKLGM